MRRWRSPSAHAASFIFQSWVSGRDERHGPRASFAGIGAHLSPPVKPRSPAPSGHFGCCAVAPPASSWPPPHALDRVISHGRT
eukprot:2443533-Prymnesium_polylepis.1